jgi:hypothetical protein
MYNGRGQVMWDVFAEAIEAFFRTILKVLRGAFKSFKAM